MVPPEALPRAAAPPEAALRSWIETRLAATPITEEPFPHLFVTQIFPPEFFERLRSAWPPTALFKGDSKGRKYDLVPTRSSRADARASGYAALPREAQELWDFFVFTVNRTIVGPQLREKFRPQIDDRIARIRDAHARGLIEYGMGRTAVDWEPVANVGRFMMRGPGSELKPHVDSMPYLLTVLHYFPDEDVQGADGTVLYKAEAPLDFERCVRTGSTEYFDAAGIAAREVQRLPFAPNILVAFPNMLDAAHGAAPPEHGLRRLFQYHLSLKADHEKV